LRIPRDRFQAFDLTESLRLERRFDLALSLETAEHLPESRGESFVQDLCRLAPAVFFSAAIPKQGGLDHKNEQWPAYWEERFRACGYTPVDCVRDEVWGDERVLWWYAQNAILFVSEETATRSGLETHPGYGRALARVHPALFHTYSTGRYQEARGRLFSGYRQFARSVARISGAGSSSRV
jgi:hypothetical protein